jgi:hypothetical protein
VEAGAIVDGGAAAGSGEAWGTSAGDVATGADETPALPVIVKSASAITRTPEPVDISFIRSNLV